MNNTKIVFTADELNLLNKGLKYRVSIKYFPEYKNLLQENYVEYKLIFTCFNYQLDAQFLYSVIYVLH
jgi:hypothetical protein